MIYNLKIFKRLLREFRNPTSPRITKFKKYFSTKKKENIKKKLSHIHAICDFELTGYTYNFSEFLVQLNKYLLDNQISKYDLILVPPYSDTLDFRSEYYDDKLIARSGKDQNEINWRIYNIIFPLIYCSSFQPHKVILLKERKDLKTIKIENTYPENYDYNNPKINDINDLYLNTYSMKNIGLKASVIGKEFVEKFLKSTNLDANKIITLNIRNQKFDPKRNTNKKELLKFAEYLHEKEYLPLIIPDTNEMWEADEQFQKFIISKEISCSVSLRIALYERVLLNIFVPGGITTLAYLNEHVNFIFFKAGFIEGSVVHTEDQWLVEGNFPFSNKKQILAYKDDTFINLKDEFNNFIRLTDGKN